MIREMDSDINSHLSEKLNIRCFYLRLIGKLWILPAAAAVGALIGWILYFSVTVIFAPARTYSSESKLYIDFAYDESGTVKDYYNAYTWNDLMSTDDILDRTMQNLSDAGVPEITDETAGQAYGSMKGVTRDEVIADISAQIPSDGRLMVLTVTSHDEELTAAIAEAADESLVNFGKTHDEFIGIDIRSCSEAKLVTYTDRTRTAVITGAVLSLLAAMAGLFLIYTLDDAVYVPEDCEKRYGYPVIGMLMKDEKPMPDIFRNELIAGADRFMKNCRRVVIIAPKRADKKPESVQMSDESAINVCREFSEIVRSNYDFQSSELMAAGIPGSSPESYRRLKEADGVVIAVSAGDSRGALMEHIISQLTKHDCPIIGMLLVDCNPDFMKRYYKI